MNTTSNKLPLPAEQLIDDYRLAYRSRQAAIIGRREVLSGKAKFGIFGDGKELIQLAMAHHFRVGDWRSGYYRDQTWMLAMGQLTLQQLFAQLYAHLEKAELKEIRDRRLRLPDESQKLIYDNQGNPIAQAYFYFVPKIVVFLNGSAHYLDFVKAGDEEKRRKLRALGYRLTVIDENTLDGGLKGLKNKVG